VYLKYAVYFQICTIFSFEFETLFLIQRYRREEEEDDPSDTDDDYVPYVSAKYRKKQLLTKLGKIGQLKEESNGVGKSSSENEKDDADNDDGQVWGRKSNISLLDQHTELKKLAEGMK